MNNEIRSKLLLARPEIILQSLLLFWFVIAIFILHDVGLADNGDFTRSMMWLTTGPVGFDTNWPAEGTEEWGKRFFHQWLPYWNSDWTLATVNSSVLLLWLPGALANELFYSRQVLYLANLSLGPKLVILAFLLSIFYWINHRPKHHFILTLLTGVPLVLMITNLDYLAYFNSFYQETAAICFLLLMILSLTWLRHKPSLLTMVISLIVIFFLSTSKRSTLYWSVLAIPVAVTFYFRSRKHRSKTRQIALFSTALILVLGGGAYRVTNPPQLSTSFSVNSFHSFYSGVLTFSNRPLDHLQRLGLEGTEDCIGVSAYSAHGQICFAEIAPQLSFSSVLQVVLAEPSIAIRAGGFTLGNMQDVTIDYLAKFSLDDPMVDYWPPASLEGFDERFWPTTLKVTELNLWSWVKYNAFPRGYLLLVVLLALIVGFVFSIRYQPVMEDASIIGLICSIGCLIDAAVAFLGEGWVDLIKHLFLANVLFDLALITFLGIAFYTLADLIKDYRLRQRN